MVTIVATPLAFLLCFATVVGVSGWLGYLLGRIRTVAPPPSPWPPPQREPSAAAPLIFGAALVLLGAIAFAAVFNSGLPSRVDGAGAVGVAAGVLLLVFGCRYVAIGLRNADRYER